MMNIQYKRHIYYKSPHMGRRMSFSSLDILCGMERRNNKLMRIWKLVLRDAMGGLMISLKEAGHKFILWDCRESDDLWHGNVEI